MAQVILVNREDESIGSMEKMEAHQKGLLHRAFSIFIFNTNGEMLLQQRGEKKYHSANLWTNACCSHPSPGEDLEAAAHKRLGEEMGFDTYLEKIFSFTYAASFDNGLTEYEFDHVFAGIYDGPVSPNDVEARDYRFMNMEAISNSICAHPHQYTSWFRIAFPKMEDYLASKKIKDR